MAETFFADNSLAARLTRIRRDSYAYRIWQQRGDRLLSEMSDKQLRLAATRRGVHAVAAMPTTITTGLLPRELDDLAQIVGAMLLARAARQRVKEATA
jgi:hypothetical protein